MGGVTGGAAGDAVLLDDDGLAINAPLVRGYVDESGAAMDWLVDMCEQRHPGKIKWYHATEHLPTDQYVPGSDPYPSWPGTWKREDLAEDGSWTFTGMNSTIQDLYDFDIETAPTFAPRSTPASSSLTRTARSWAFTA